MSGFFHSGIMFLRFIYVVALCISILFLFIAAYYIVLYGHTTFVLSIYPVIDISFYFLAIVNSAATYVHIKVFVWT